MCCLLCDNLNAANPSCGARSDGPPEISEIVPRGVDQRVSASCGNRNPNGLGPVSGNSRFGEWPHACAVLKRELIGTEPVTVYQCSASLIAAGVVLTGGHCVNDKK